MGCFESSAVLSTHFQNSRWFQAQYFGKASVGFCFPKIKFLTLLTWVACVRRDSLRLDSFPGCRRAGEKGMEEKQRQRSGSRLVTTEDSNV